MAEERAHNIHVPPKMQGWLKKRGHIVVNWKTRYAMSEAQAPCVVFGLCR